MPLYEFQCADCGNISEHIVAGSDKTGGLTCSKCGSALWVFDDAWPELIHPFASAIDTHLPVPPERTHLMLDFKAPWVEVRADPQDKQFARYPDESIAAWHQRLGLERDVGRKSKIRVVKEVDSPSGRPPDDDDSSGA